MQLLSHLRNHRLLKYGVIALVSLSLISFIALFWGHSRSSDVSPMYIAVAAPTTGSRDAAAKEMIQSVQLYLDSVNREGGIHGQPVKLLVFDDKGDSNAARDVPHQVSKSPALVVLGHLNSYTTVEAAPIYQALQIPAITGTASEDYITQANPYYFRTVFTNSVQGSTVALYMQKALGFKTASIIYSNDRLGQTLDEAFEETFKREGTIKNAWKFDPRDKNLAQSVDAIVTKLAADPNPGMVFLAMDDVAGKDFIVAIRRRKLKAPLFGSQSLVRETSLKLFEQYEEEKQQPGYFLNDIYIPAPLIFDSAGVDAQDFASLYKKTYGNFPSYVGAAYYDVAHVAVQALRQAEIKNTPASVKGDRKKVRDQLEKINSRDVAVKGLNGPIYFDATHDNTPPVRFGQYVDQRLISAPVQLSPITDLSLVNLNEEVKAGNVLHLVYRLKNQYFWRQQVVYTGIDINKVSRVDQSKSSFTADFYLWMRYVGEVDPTSIQFPNGVANSVNQNLPLFDPKQFLRSEVIDGLNYLLYQIQGEFKGSFDYRDYPFDQQKLKIYFQNTQVPNDRLIYVVDTFGLKLPGVNKDQQQSSYKNLQLWQFQDLQYARETFSSTSTRGNPLLFNTNLRIDYPGLSAIITLQRRFSVFLVKTLLPLGLLVLVLYSTLFFSENLAKERLTVAIAALLSSAVLLTAINTQLSDTGYTVAIEYGFYVFFSLCLFCILIGLIIERLRQAGRKKAVRYLDYAARTFYVLVVLSTIAFYTVSFGNRL